MIRITTGQLKFLRHGRPITINHPNPHQYHRDRSYAVTTDGRHAAACRIQVTDATDTTIRIQLATIDPPLLLAAHSEYGYTSNPAQAMHNEPEAVAPAELERLARQAERRREQEFGVELASRKARSIAIRLKEAARRGDTLAYKALGVELSSLARRT